MDLAKPIIRDNIHHEDPQFNKMMATITDNLKVNQLTKEGPGGSSCTTTNDSPPILISPNDLGLLRKSEYLEEDLYMFKARTTPLPDNLLNKDIEVIETESAAKAPRKDIKDTTNDPNQAEEEQSKSPEKENEGEIEANANLPEDEIETEAEEKTETEHTK